MPVYKDKDTGTWYYQVNYKENGKYKQKKKRGFSTKREATAAMVELEDSLNKGTHFEASNRLYKDFIADWLSDKRRTVKASTWNVYNNLMINHILPMRKDKRGKSVGLGDLEISEITARHILDVYNDLSERKAIADANIQKCHTLIKDSFKQARIENLVRDNPAEDIKRPQAKKTEMNVWNLSQSQTFLKATQHDRLHIAFLLALTTGMRQGEILGLRWKDVNFEQNTISITQILSHDGKSFDVGAKTISGVRPIRVDQHTMSELKRHHLKVKKERMEFADVFEDHDLVISTKFGKPVSPRNLNRSFKRLIHEAGLDEIRFHDLRHTHVTMLIKNRETPQAIAERLGWSDTRMIDNYAHILPDIQHDVADSFGKSFYNNNA